MNEQDYNELDALVLMLSAEERLKDAKDQINTAAKTANDALASAETILKGLRNTIIT